VADRLRFLCPAAGAVTDTISRMNTSNWQDLPHTRLLSDVSLWSADLANLQAGLELVEPFADSFHLDVSDAHFVPSLLFFPDLVRALRPLTTRPFHIHLMVERPTTLIEDFVASGADLITIHAEAGKSEAAAAIQAILRADRLAGLALRLDTPVAAAEPYLDRIDALLLLGTVPGSKARTWRRKLATVSRARPPSWAAGALASG
jgi:ribulose-phosphate 3-epimerase